MGMNRKRQIGMTFLLFVAVILVATLPVAWSQSTAYPCSGTWDGTVGPGSGTISVLGTDHQVSTSSVITGTFDGDTTKGNIEGKITTNYTVPDMSTKGTTVGTIKGTYAMSIDSSGTVTATVTIPLTGDFAGNVQVTLNGQESQSGQLKGTWTGTLTVTQVTYNFLPLSAHIVASGSGEFQGTAQVPAAQTTASTSSTTAAISTTTAAVVSTTAQASTTQAMAASVSYLPYALVVVVVVIIIIVAALAVRMRRPKKP
jgi:hypothetical protein